jgi:hypothetical protein
MTRPHAAVVMGASLALHGLLLGGALAALPGPLRLVLAFAVLILTPGAAFVALGARPPGGRWLAGGWAFGFGVAWCAALALLARVAQVSFLALLPWTPLTSVLPWTAVVLRGGGARGGVAGARAPGLPRLAAIAVLIAVGLATLHAARLGTTVGFTTDSPDHVGTLRRMLQTGELFPRDAFFRDAAGVGADPRKGLWHAAVAWIARLAGLDPLAVWRWLGALILPFFVLNVAALGYLCRGPTGAALAAWIFVLTYGGGPAQAPLRQAVYATRVADQLALAAAVALLADLGRRARAHRLAAVALAFAAATTHVFAALQLALVGVALALALVARDRRPGPEVRRLAGTALLAAIVCLPYLLLRLHQGGGPANVIHAEPQGLTWLAGPWFVVSIGQLWGWMGLAWVLVPLSWPWLWARGRANPAVLYLLAASLAVALTVYDPLAMALLEPRLGYLAMRFVWIVPFAALVAWLLPELATVARAPGSRARRALAAGTLVLALALLAPAVRDAAQALADPARVAAQDRSEDPRRWQDAFTWMSRHLPPDAVVLSDPATSYLVPMTTGRPVVTLLDQHGPPGDPRGLARILDARDALDPWADWARVRGVLRRYGVAVVALDGRFAAPPALHYWSPSRRWFAAERARLDREPAAFAPLYDTGDFVLYQVRGEGLDTLAAPAPPRPWLEPWRPPSASGATPAAARGPEPDLPMLVDLALSPAAAGPGDSLTGIARWHAARPARPASYLVQVRFDRDLPGGFSPPAFFGKPARKLLERVRHERYRFRADHVPAAGAYGVDLWRDTEVVRDSFGLRVPPDAASGAYRVEVHLLRQPHYPDLRLSDWFFDRDSYSGTPAGTLVVRRREERPR